MRSLLDQKWKKMKGKKNKLCYFYYMFTSLRNRCWNVASVSFITNLNCLYLFLILVTWKSSSPSGSTIFYSGHWDSEILSSYEVLSQLDRQYHRNHTNRWIQLILWSYLYWNRSSCIKLSGYNFMRGQGGIATRPQYILCIILENNVCVNYIKTIMSSRNRICSCAVSTDGGRHWANIGMQIDRSKSRSC